MDTIKESLRYLDDNLLNLMLFYEVFKEKYDVDKAEAPSQALKQIKIKEYKVIVVDYSMPEMTGLEFIERAAKIIPNSIFMILTAYPDLDVAVAAINQGNVFRFLYKPWKTAELANTMELAFETYYQRQDTRILVEK